MTAINELHGLLNEAMGFDDERHECPPKGVSGRYYGLDLGSGFLRKV